MEASRTPGYLNEESARRAAANLVQDSGGHMLLCWEEHLIPDGNDMCLARIIVTAERWPWPYRTDLGRRIADVIRADCTTVDQ